MNETNRLQNVATIKTAQIASELSEWSKRQPLAVRIAAQPVILDLRVGAEPRALEAHLCALEEARRQG